MGVNFFLLERISRYKWSLTFNSRDMANIAITNRYVQESKYDIHIPWYLIFHKVVVKCILVDVPVDEKWKELSESNPNLVFDKEDIFRLRSRSYVDGVATFQDSTAVRVNLRSSSIPSHVFMWRSRMNITPYIPGIRQCFNCGQMNHATKFCKNNAKCLSCGLDSHTDGSSCSNKLNCINCSGNHRSLSRDCPEIIIKKKTTELMATQNLDFNTARKMMVHGSPIMGSHSENPFNLTPPRRFDDSEFPPLANPCSTLIEGSQRPPSMTSRGHHPTSQGRTDSFAEVVSSILPSLLKAASFDPNVFSEILLKLDRILEFFDNIAVARVIEDPLPPTIDDLLGNPEINQIPNSPISIFPCST